MYYCDKPKEEITTIDRFTAWEDGFHRGTSSASVKFYTSLLRRIKQAHLNERTKTTVKSSILGLLLPLHLAMESDISGVRLADNSDECGAAGDWGGNLDAAATATV